MCVSGNAVELSNFSSIYQNVMRYNLLFIILSILNIILICMMDIKLSIKINKKRIL